jgi:hypothetical protein
MQPTIVTGLSNQQFLERYAAAGRIGLSAGTSLVDRMICRAQRHLDDQQNWGSWSHAFVFQGQRPDGHHWVIESDLQVHSKHLQFGVQENRITKYFDEKLYTCLAVLDLGLTGKQLEGVLSEGLELSANHTRYSLRELVGTLVALRQPHLRGKNNLLAQQRSVYCSAFVQHLFRKAGIDLAPGVDLKNTTPEHLARTAVPHRRFQLQREMVRSKIDTLRGGLRRRVDEMRVVVAGSKLERRGSPKQQGPNP